MLPFVSTVVSLFSILLTVVNGPLYHSHDADDEAHGPHHGAQVHAHFLEHDWKPETGEGSTHLSTYDEHHGSHGKAVNAFVMQPAPKAAVAVVQPLLVDALVIRPTTSFHVLPEQPVRVHDPPSSRLSTPRSPPH